MKKHLLYIATGLGALLGLTLAISLPIIGLISFIKLCVENEQVAMIALYVILCIFSAVGVCLLIFVAWCFGRDIIEKRKVEK